MSCEFSFLFFFFPEMMSGGVRLMVVVVRGMLRLGCWGRRRALLSADRLLMR